jgi:hypothetical protein
MIDPYVPGTTKRVSESTDEEVDKGRAWARDQRLNAQGAVGVTWRNQFLRVWEASDEKD